MIFKVPPCADRECANLRPRSIQPVSGLANSTFPSQARGAVVLVQSAAIPAPPPLPRYAVRDGRTERFCSPHPTVVSHVKLHWVVQVLRMVQSDSLVHISGNRARIIHPPGRLAEAPALVDPTLRVQNTPSPIRHSYAFGHSHPQQSRGGTGDRQFSTAEPENRNRFICVKENEH